MVTHTFGELVIELSKGNKIRRPHWPEGQYLYLCHDRLTLCDEDDIPTDAIAWEVIPTKEST